MSEESFLRVAGTLILLWWIALAASVLVFVPLALWRKTRTKAGYGLYGASCVFFFVLWAFSSVITYVATGLTGLLIGLFMGGVGVIPIAIYCAFFTLGKSHVGVTLCVMIVAAYVALNAATWYLKSARAAVDG